MVPESSCRYRVLREAASQLFIDRGGRIHSGTQLMPDVCPPALLTTVLEPETRRAEVGDHGIAESHTAASTSVA